MSQTPAQRKASERQRRAARGEAEFRAWMPAEHHPAMRRVADWLILTGSNAVQFFNDLPGVDIDAVHRRKP